MSNENLAIKKAFELAVQKHQNNNLQDAQNYYQKVLALDPNHVSTLYNLGSIFEKLREYQKAKDYFEKVIKINPNYINAHNNLGIIFKELGENQKAKECYEKAIGLNPNYANAHNNLGIIFKELGQYQKAKECYEKAIEINPNYINALNNLGIIFQDLGENQKAKDCFEKAIEIDPNHTMSYWNSHGLASSVDEALSILKKLYKVDDKHTKARIMISILECYKGNFEKVNEMLNSSESNHPLARSVKWVLSLPKLPSIFFDKNYFFDALLKY